MTTTVHPYTADDWELMRVLRLRTLQDAPEAFNTAFDDEVDQDEQFWRGRAGSGGHLWAAVDGVPAGTVGLHPDGPMMVAMWVDPAYRGHGVGDLLVEAISVLATTHWTEPLTLWVATENAPARRLYARHGFVPTGRSEPMRGIPGRVQIEMIRE